MILSGVISVFFWNFSGLFTKFYKDKFPIGDKKTVDDKLCEAQV